MPSILVEEYIREDGTSPYKHWFDSLDRHAAAKVVTAKLRMSIGNTSSIKWFDGIGECKIDWGPGYRVYLVQDGATLIVLLGGGTKTTQRKDIQHARLLSAEYKVRKRQLAISMKALGKGAGKR